MKYLAVDFGSTYTKITAVDESDAKVLGTASAFTTINTDIRDGLNVALEKLESEVGKFDYDELLCCSSAGGGLKMVALGLVPELTAKAAKMAAASAGAKVVKTYSYEISKAEQNEIFDINPDLVLLCGGTDGGNKDVIKANAKLLCDIDRKFSIIAAGNKSVSHDLENIFNSYNKDYVITKNVMPAFGKLDIEHAKGSIRDLFIKKIIIAKGLSKVQEMTGHEIVPTPLAVMNGCELLSMGTRKEKGLGEFLAVDIGGATTDFYSMAKGNPKDESVLIKGLPEPYSKRTVEGDLGMRYSLRHLYSEIDSFSLSEALGVELAELESWVEKCTEAPDTVAPESSKERLIDEAFARCAVELAAERHCGLMESVYTPVGEVYTLTGKDLSGVSYVVGIGGVIVNSLNPSKILEGSVYNIKNYTRMLPRKPEFLMDRRYIFSSMGLISMVNPDLALKIMKDEIKLIRQGE